MNLHEDYLQTQEEKVTVSENMIRYGGSFIKALGEALRHADPMNTTKIKHTFSKYWEQYLNWRKK